MKIIIPILLLLLLSIFILVSGCYNNINKELTTTTVLPTTTSSTTTTTTIIIKENYELYIKDQNSFSECMLREEVGICYAPDGCIWSGQVTISLNEEITESEAMEIASDYNLEVLRYYDFKTIPNDQLVVKVEEGKEKEWSCVLEADERVFGASPNQKVRAA